ncbi:MAG: CheR family methyltransferase, partial [Desulfobacterales bacterium]|nr:CheR family methyltransferase [Desulfobacterales bacterium]
MDVARRGIYPESIVRDVSRERLKKFFTKGPTGFKISKKIRDLTVFSLHSIVKDPPFSRLDLASCRNLMIYMDVILQKKIIPYRTGENVIAGVVMTFVDVNEVKQAGKLRRLATVLEDA